MPFDLTRIHALVVFLVAAFTAWEYQNGSAVALYSGDDISPSGFDLSSFPFFFSTPAPPPVKLDLTNSDKHSSSNETFGGVVVLNNDTDPIDNASPEHSAEQHIEIPPPIIKTLPLRDFLLRCFQHWFYTWLSFLRRFYGLLILVTDFTTLLWITEIERKQAMDRILDNLLSKVRETLAADRAQAKGEHEEELRQITAEQAMQLENKKTEIANLKEQIEKLEEASDIHGKTITAKDKESEELKRQLEEKDELLNDKTKTISNHNDNGTQTEDLASTTINTSIDMEARIRDLELQVHQRDELIAGLQESLANEARRNHSNMVSIQALRTTAAATSTPGFAAGQFINPAYRPRLATTPYHQPPLQPPPTTNPANQHYGNQHFAGRGGAFGGFQRGGFGSSRRGFGH